MHPANDRCLSSDIENVSVRNESVETDSAWAKCNILSLLYKPPVRPSGIPRHTWIWRQAVTRLGWAERSIIIE